MTDVREAYGLGGAPMGIAVIVLFAIVMARSHATYWAGRAVVRGAEQVKRGPGWWRTTIRHLEAWTGTRAAQRGLDLVRRWGPVAVTLAYLMIGVQTAIFAAAGLIKMPYLRFTIASVPGAIVWAIVWATVGFGAFWGALALFAASPWALLAVVVLLAGVTVWVVRRRLLKRAADVRDDEPADALD